LSLFNAAVAYEQAGDLEQGITTYRELSEKYPKNFLVPHALFAMGRLYEADEDFQSAFEVYDRLEDEFPQSNWTKMGRNRIIDLKVKGLIAE
jgi:TolA-binding protein